MKNGLQKFGKFLSAMVMPNIGAFIAWGFITALFIADGWIPNAKLASIQPYMLTFLLPMLIALFKNNTLAGSIKIAAKGINFAFTSTLTPAVNTANTVVSLELVDLMDSQC